MDTATIDLGGGEPIIRLRGVAKSYWREELEIPVLQGIDLDIPSGAYIALMGPSGSGKTTLLNLIAGIDRPTGGSLEVCGSELNDLDDDELAAWRNGHVGFIFQNYNLVPVLTAFENVELPLLLTGAGRGERRDRVEQALGLVNLTDKLRNYPRQLSGGQRLPDHHPRPVHHGPRRRPDHGSSHALRLRLRARRHNGGTPAHRRQRGQPVPGSSGGGPC